MQPWHAMGLALLLASGLTAPLAAQPVSPLAAQPMSPLAAQPVSPLVVPADPPAADPGEPTADPGSSTTLGTMYNAVVGGPKIAADPLTHAAVVLAAAGVLLPGIGLGALIPLEPLLLPAAAGAIVAGAVARDMGWGYYERAVAFAGGALGGGVAGFWLGNLGMAAVSDVSLRSAAALVAAAGYALDHAVRMRQAIEEAAAPTPH